MIEEKIKSAVRDVPGFPRPGIVFKDITPVLKDAKLCEAIVTAFAERVNGRQTDVIVGVESRGFLFGMLLAQRLSVPFVPVRKEGKLPYRTVRQDYELEYGKAAVEMHEDSIVPGQRVLIHDDLLATGGTVSAVSALVERLGGKVTGYCFLAELGFLNGRACLARYSDNIQSLSIYQS